MKTQTKMMLLAISSLLAACQAKHEHNDLSYSLTQGNCPTGKVKYANQADLCVALKDDARNNHCVLSMRYDKFREECPGQSWSN